MKSSPSKVLISDIRNILEHLEQIHQTKHGTFHLLPDEPKNNYRNRFLNQILSIVLQSDNTTWDFTTEQTTEIDRFAGTDYPLYMLEEFFRDGLLRQPNDRLKFTKSFIDLLVSAVQSTYPEDTNVEPDGTLKLKDH